MKLQGVYGNQGTKKVKDLIVGDIITWNYGYQSEVVELVPSKTGKTYTVKLKSLTDNIIRERKMSYKREVAI